MIRLLRVLCVGFSLIAAGPGMAGDGPLHKAIPN